MEQINIIREKDKLPGTGLHEPVENQVRRSSKVQWQGALSGRRGNSVMRHNDSKSSGVRREPGTGTGGSAAP